MARKFKVLQIGPVNYATEFEDKNDVVWHYIHNNELSEVLESQWQEEQDFDLIVVQTHYTSQLEVILKRFSAPFNTLIESQYWSEAFKLLSETNKYYYRELIAETNADIIEKLKTISFAGQYGDKITPDDVIINPQFEGIYQYNGHVNIEIEGDFGDSFQPLLHWKRVLIADQAKAIDIWPEFEIEGDIQLQYTFRVGAYHEVDQMIETYTLTQDELNHPLTLPRYPVNAFIAVSVKAKGAGKVKIGAVHKRWSRLEYGDFILGGHRYADEKRNEFIYYFHPGDMKPPLNVYFGGYRTAEGFEAYNLMKNMDAPFLLFGDPRNEGGNFYIGTQAYEEAITQTIKAALSELNFTEQDLIMSGLSMGSFGALYYSDKVQPKAIIVGKPLVNMGDIARNMRLVRPNDFGTMLDVLLKYTGGTDETAIARLNHKFWNHMENQTLSKTTLAIAYMEHDDYDPNAYTHLVQYFGEQKAKIISRGIPGRHNDDTPTIVNWFLNFYKMILKNEFGR